MATPKTTSDITQHNIINQSCTKNAFKVWLIAEGNKEKKANWIIKSFELVSKYALEKKIIFVGLLDIDEIKEFHKAIEAIQSNKFFRVLKKDLYKFLLSNSKMYISFLKNRDLKKSIEYEPNHAISQDILYIVSDADNALYEKFGERISEVYRTLKINDRHVYLTVQQISASISMEPDVVLEILEKASWVQKRGDGYILGHNNYMGEQSIAFDVSKTFEEPTKVECVLKENFRRGFRPTSIMDKNRFVSLYSDKYNKEISTDEVVAEVKKKCFKFDDRLFLPKALVGLDTVQNIIEYLTKYFIQKDILFYNVLYSAFEDKFESYIYSPEMLAAFMQKVIMGTPIFYSDRYCSVKIDAKPDISAEVIDYLINKDVPCSYGMIYDHFSHLNHKDIYNVLHYNNPEILGNSKTEYFHVKTAHLTESERKDLRATTEMLLSNSKFITCNEVMENLEKRNHALMERLNTKFSVLGIRRIFTYYLRAYFDVHTGIITYKGQKMTVIDAFADFAQSHKKFTVNDVQKFAEYTGTVPYWDTIHRCAVRINASDFVSDNNVDFNVDAIDSAIGYYCSDYITLSEISDYSRFPSCGTTWNIYLLQQYVFRFSKQYKLLSLGFSKGNVSGVIVRKQSGYDNFDSVIIDALAKTKITSPNEAIQYLCDKGFIAEKRYKKHADLLKIAMACRNNR